MSRYLSLIASTNMNKKEFICGQTCDCLDTECKGNPDAKLVKEFKQLQNFDEAIVSDMLQKLSQLEIWTRESISNCIGKLDNKIGASLNVSLTGKASNPVPLFDCIEILGKDIVSARLANPTRLMLND
jgi:hypothetical protein